MENKKLDNNPLISILVPIYGVEKYIERCAVSLMEQTYQNIQYIFVNDCTKDNSIDILMKVVDRYPARKNQICIISHEKNRGLAAARNTAICACSGEYFMHVDSDDWLELDAVQFLVEKIKENDADIINFGYYSEYGKYKTESVVSSDKVKLINDILICQTHASIWSRIYNRFFFIESGVKIVEGLNQGEDFVIVPRLLHKARNVAYVNKSLYHYELSNQSSYTKNVKMSAIQNMFEADNILYDYFSQVSDKDNYEKSLQLIHLRSMLYLIKKSDYTNVQRIILAYESKLKTIEKKKIVK